ncbi:MAG: TIGR04139 family peptide modification target [Pedobacter sp.]|uniref:TIGR04139 family peptide modification target n=1 Tax=Pedobacter sp. TaxID=1411316 RepID=UPI000D361A11
MKKLNGIKKSISSLENKKLMDLKSINGGVAADGLYGIKSNVSFGEGCVEYDYYTGPYGTGTYFGRAVTGC